MQDREKPTSPLRQSHDNEVVGFAEAPITPTAPPTHFCTTTLQPNYRNRHESGPNDISVFPLSSSQPPVAVGPQPTTRPLPNIPPSLTEWRKVVRDYVLFLAIATPWMVSTILSWMPITKIALKEAPPVVMVSLIASTIELGLVFLILILSWPNEKKSDWDETFESVMTILIVEAMGTGAYVWWESAVLFCSLSPNQIACRVGADLLQAIGIYRVFGGFGVFAVAVLLGQCVVKLMELLQKREDEKARGIQEKV